MSDKALIQITAAAKALERAKSIPEVKTIRDQAQTISAYMKRQKYSLQAQNDAAELKIRAERKLGQLIPEQFKHGKDRKSKSRSHDVTLIDAGIGRMDSHRWQQVASVPETRFEQLISQAKQDGGITTGKIVREVKETQRQKTRDINAKAVADHPIDFSIKEAIKAGLNFPTLLIDPPWDWGDEGDEDQLGRARPTYTTMPIAELERLPIAKLAAKDAHLYLWITNRSLPKGFGLLETWGFRYVTCLTWCKPHFGMGNYFRGQTEHILFGVRGSSPLRRKNVGTWFTAKRGPGGHSSKPLAAYELIESCSHGPYGELFARSHHGGWTALGAEA